MSGKVYLIPTVLQDDEQALKAIPMYVIDAAKKCSSFFVENEKTARRYLKKIWKEIVIDDYFWMPIQKAEASTVEEFSKRLLAGETIGIISEAGCPGVADPGQILIEKAQQLNATIMPLTGPNSILLALMASGMNGQHFEFVGYLPIEQSQRRKAIKSLEETSAKNNKTIIFIETPYRNNPLIKDMLQQCKPDTKLCIACDITSEKEMIKTKTITQWKKEIPDIHKRPAIFLLYAGRL